MFLFCEAGNIERPNLAHFFGRKRMWCCISLQMGKWFEYLSSMWRFGFKSLCFLWELWNPHLSVPKGNALTARPLGVWVWGASRHHPVSFLRNNGEGSEWGMWPRDWLARSMIKYKLMIWTQVSLLQAKCWKSGWKEFFFFPSVVWNSGYLNLWSLCLFLADLANSYSCWVLDFWTASITCPTFHCRAELGCLSVGCRV